jgi:hypothetical protein
MPQSFALKARDNGVEKDMWIVEGLPALQKAGLLCTLPKLLSDTSSNEAPKSVLFCSTKHYNAVLLVSLNIKTMSRFS